MEKSWKLLNNKAPQCVEDIVQLLLENRGLEREEEVQDFFQPRSPAEIVSEPSLVGLDETSLKKTVNLIQKVIDQQRLIVIHGDYDVDGLCATAILWETLYKGMGYENILPFIPNRFEHGYGLSLDSVNAISKLLLDWQAEQNLNPRQEGSPLLITVDCGITATEEVEYARSKGFDVVITDHHQQPNELPESQTAVWTDTVCGAGISWVLSVLLRTEFQSQEQGALKEEFSSAGLDLVAVGTLCDLEPLIGPNRSLVKFGLDNLNRNTREGLAGLKQVAGLRGKEIGTYEVGWILGPRINAAGRLADATDALRLLCTRDKEAARVLAERLNTLNRERQVITNQAVEKAKKELLTDLVDLPSFIILDHEDYHEGIIGLVASGLVKDFNRPSIAISRGAKVSKGSARSIKGFNIIAALRECADCLLDVGGHPMAAGFTIETRRIVEFRERLLNYGEEKVSRGVFNPVIEVDCKINAAFVGTELWAKLKQFEPFGVGNPRPKFLIENIEVCSVRSVGSDNKHLKLRLRTLDGQILSAIAFNKGDWTMRLLSGDQIDVVANLQLNKWNGEEAVELRIKELRKNMLGQK